MRLTFRQYSGLIDENDFDLVSQHQWSMSGGGKYFHTWSRDIGTNIWLHRLIMGDSPVGIYVDHINGDTKDNRRANLRFATQAQNSANRGLTTRPSSSRYKGVFFDNRGGLWRAEITSNGKSRYLGRFSTEEEAAAAYDRAALLFHGEYARTNAQLGLLED